MLWLLGDFVPQTTDQGSATRPRWGTPFKNLGPQLWQSGAAIVNFY